MKKAVITILGLIGSKESDKKAKYLFEDKEFDCFNSLHMLVERYAKTHDIVPFFTAAAKTSNEIVLQKSGGLHVEFDSHYFIDDEDDFKDIFNRIDEAINHYDEVVVDVSHGFRHLPILMTVDLIIQNFQNTDKIKNILFAKEVEQYKRYEVIDLKEYLDIANIAFVLSTFEKNYTVANHIKSQKYSSLIDRLNAFSNDIMALSLNNLFQKSSKELMEELEKIDDVAIRSQAQNLKDNIAVLTFYKGKKRYLTYYDLSKDLFGKNYMLLSLSLLFESIRLYIKVSIKKAHPELVESVEEKLDHNLYRIGDFFKNLSWKDYGKYQKEHKKIDISKEEYNKLKNTYPKDIEGLYKKIDATRNNLAHANSDGKSFKDIKKDIKDLLGEYHDTCIKEKRIGDLMSKFAK